VQHHEHRAGGHDAERCRAHGDPEHEQGADDDLRQQDRQARSAARRLHGRVEHRAGERERQQAQAEVDAQQAGHPGDEALERPQDDQLRAGEPCGGHAPQDGDDDRGDHPGEGERGQQRRRVHREAVRVLDEPGLVGGHGSGHGDRGAEGDGEGGGGRSAEGGGTAERVHACSRIDGVRTRSGLALHPTPHAPAPAGARVPGRRDQGPGTGARAGPLIRPCGTGRFAGDVRPARPRPQERRGARRRPTSSSRPRLAGRGRPPTADRLGPTLTRERALELFDSQLTSRHLDLAARWLRGRGQASTRSARPVTRATRPSPPPCARATRRSCTTAPVRSTSSARARCPAPTPSRTCCSGWSPRPRSPSPADAQGLRRKELAVLPRRPPIASHLPRALGVALLDEPRRQARTACDWPADAVTVCSFGDASANHSTATGASTQRSR
jgi:hypothetical protein